MADYTQTDIYEYYDEELDGELDWKTFRRLCEDFNQAVMEDIILAGGRFNQGSYLSTISILRIERNYKNKQIDWKASYELKEELIEEGEKPYDPETGEGENWLVYHTDRWYCRFYWRKATCTVPNKSVYSFRPTGGDKGNKTKLKELLHNDDLAQTRFEKASQIN